VTDSPYNTATNQKKGKKEKEKSNKTLWRGAFFYSQSLLVTAGQKLKRLDREALSLRKPRSIGIT